MNTESKAAQELREWTKHYGFVPVIKAAEAVLAELADASSALKDLERRCGEAFDRIRAYAGSTEGEMAEVAVERMARQLAACQAERDASLEQHRMEMVAIMTATIQNTKASVKDRIGKNSPYWTQAYQDVCIAIDREMREREAKNTAEAKCAEMRVVLDELFNCPIKHFCVPVSELEPTIAAWEKIRGFGSCDMGHQQLCDYVTETAEEELARLETLKGRPQ